MPDPQPAPQDPAAAAAAEPARTTPRHGAARRVALGYAAFSAIWILVSDQALAWLLRDPVALARASTLKGWVFVCGTALLIHLLLRRRDAATDAVPAEPAPAAERRLAWAVGLTIVALTVAGTSLALRQHRLDAEATLVGTADLRAKQAAAWAQRRLDDGALVREIAPARLRERLAALPAERGYRSASLLDTERRVTWTTGPLPDPATDLPPPQPEHARLLGPQRDEHGVPHLDLLVPLLPAQGGGFALLRLASHDLPPLALGPAADGSERIRTLLVRRVGEQIVYFGAADGAATSHLPAGGSIVAASAGSVVEGLDDRGHPALGIVRPVAGTPWLLLTRIDGVTLLRERWRAVSLALLAGTLAGLGATAALLLNRQRRALARAEAERRRQADRFDTVALFEAIADSSQDTIFAKDLQGRYLLFNRAAERMTGRSRHEVLGRDDSALFPPEQVAMLQADDRAARAGQTDCDERLSTVYGMREFTVTKGPLRDRDGGLIGIYGISRDVSELLKERALLAETNRIARIGGWSFEQHGRSIDWTDELRRILEVDADVEADTEFALGFLDAESRRRWEDALERMRRSGEPMDLELSMRTAQGRARWVRVVGQAEHDGHRVVRAHGFVQDITEAKTLRLELEGYRAELERQVRERTADLDVARSRAEAGVKVKDAFIRIVSHELRTPLHQILNLAPVLRRAAADPAEPFLEAAGRLAEVLEDVLMLSELEGGGVVPRPIDFELGAFVHQARDEIAGHAQRKGLRLDVQATPTPLWLRGDAVLLARALGNYTRNAVKFTGSGRIAIVARAENDGGGGVRLTLDVEDTGLGIAAEALPRLFTSFEPGDASITRRHGGAGLGLALTRRLAELMEGEVSVDSREGVGSRFRIRVPLARAAEHAAQAADSGREAAAEATLRAAHAGTRVLIVDDNPVNLELARELLTHVGLDVLTATGGREAVERALADAPALVLTDLVMPDVDGRDAAREMRRRGATMPIVAVSAGVDDLPRADWLDAGIVECIGKPLPAADLYEALLRWLPRATGAARDMPQQVPARAPRDEDAALPPIAGVDPSVALAVAGDDPARAMSLLRLLVRSHRDDAARIEALAAADDRQALRALAHALRGAAGNVGASAVHAAATRVETLARDAGPRPELAAAARELSGELAALIEAVQALPVGAPTAPAPAPRAASEVADAVAGLALLLSAGDTACSAFVGSRQAELRAALGDRFDAFVDLVDSFCFDEAAAWLHEHAGGPPPAAPDNPAP